MSADFPIHDSPDGRACFFALLADVHLLAVMVNMDWEIIYCNDYFLKLTGWSFAEISGKRWQDLFVPPALDDLSHLLDGLISGEPSARYHTNEMLTRSGSRRCIRWNNILLRDAAGQSVAAATIGEDVTDTRALEKELLDSSARERRQLQSELHDGLGQELFGIAMTARSLATAAERGGTVSAADLVKLSAASSQAIDTCRRIARGLSPLSDVRDGLVEALRHLTVVPEGWRGPTLAFTAVESAALRLPANVLEQVYRIAQEAVLNAMKHAQAATIRMNLTVDPEIVTLTVADDGKGLPADIESAAGVGLKIMHYRADLVHAALRIERLATGGTRIVLKRRQGEIPVSPPRG